MGSTLAKVSCHPSRLQGDQPRHLRKHPYFLSTRHRESSQGHTRRVGRINRPFTAFLIRTGDTAPTKSMPILKDSLLLQVISKYICADYTTVN